MSDMHLRTKLRKVTEAAKHGEHVPERAKNIGFRIFLVFAVFGLIGLLSLIVSLVIHGHWIGAIITFIFASFFIYVNFKLVTARDIEIP